MAAALSSRAFSGVKLSKPLYLRRCVAGAGGMDMRMDSRRAVHALLARARARARARALSLRPFAHLIASMRGYKRKNADMLIKEERAPHARRHARMHCHTQVQDQSEEEIGWRR